MCLYEDEKSYQLKNVLFELVCVLGQSLISLDKRHFDTIHEISAIAIRERERQTDKEELYELFVLNFNAKLQRFILRFDG
jgi:hypothetical protein